MLIYPGLNSQPNIISPRVLYDIPKAHQSTSTELLANSFRISCGWKLLLCCPSKTIVWASPCALTFGLENIVTEATHDRKNRGQVYEVVLPNSYPTLTYMCAHTQTQACTHTYSPSLPALLINIKACNRGQSFLFFFV